ncbi:hypothetical protein UPYG_G00074640 [Umbra pygmaea]|uniref:Uncharacterized protein n=1 Tax=Umbra pygmaea TaxID=75934 RepID=A0ABD0XX48_UMBPY
MWRRHMKTSSLRDEPADGTLYTTSQNPLRHGDPATYHMTWPSSTSTNQMKVRMLRRVRPHQRLPPSQKRVIKSRGDTRPLVDISGPICVSFQTTDL